MGTKKMSLVISDPCPNECDSERFVDDYMRLKKDGHVKRKKDVYSPRKADNKSP